MNQTTGIASDPPEASHTPVLLTEILEGLRIQPGQQIIDGTLGGGGHTAAFLAQSAPSGRVFGIDADPAAIRRNSVRFEAEVTNGRLTLAQGNFGDLANLAQAHSFLAVNAILLDLGVSSFQLRRLNGGFLLVMMARWTCALIPSRAAVPPKLSIRGLNMKLPI